jgi:hypothetical protein
VFLCVTVVSWHFECLHQCFWNLVCTSLHLNPSQIAHFLNPSHTSGSLYLFIAGQRLRDLVPAATNTRNKETVVIRAVFYDVRVISKNVDVLFCRDFSFPIKMTNSVRGKWRVGWLKANEFAIRRRACFLWSHLPPPPVAFHLCFIS